MILFERDLIKLLETSLEVSAAICTNKVPASKSKSLLPESGNARRKKSLKSLLSKLNSSKSPGSLYLSTCLRDDKINKTMYAFDPESHSKLVDAMGMKQSKFQVAETNDDTFSTIRPSFGSGATYGDDIDRTAESVTQKTVRESSSKPSSEGDELENTKKLPSSSQKGGQQKSNEEEMAEKEEKQRQENARKEKEFLEHARLKSFCSKDLDGTRMQIEYWSQRLKLAKTFFINSEQGEKAVDKITYLSKRTELDLYAKTKAVAALRMQTEMRGKVEYFHEDIIRSTERFMYNLSQYRASFKLQEKELEKNCPTLADLDSKLAALKAEGEIQLDQARAAKLEEIAQRLKKEREVILAEAQNFLDEQQQQEASNSVEEKEEEEDETSYDRPEQLRRLAEDVSRGMQEFHSTFVDSLSSCGKLALESLDARFIVRDAVLRGAEEEVPALKNVLFLRKEGKFLDECAEEQSRKICHSLMADLEARLGAEREAILNHEIQRVEFLQQCVVKTEASVKRAKFVKEMTGLL